MINIDILSCNFTDNITVANKNDQQGVNLLIGIMGKNKDKIPRLSTWQVVPWDLYQCSLPPPAGKD